MESEETIDRRYRADRDEMPSSVLHHRSNCFEPAKKKTGIWLVRLRRPRELSELRFRLESNLFW